MDGGSEMHLLTIPQFSERLKIKNSTTRSWIWKRKIEFVRIGRSIRIREDVADQLIQRGMVLPKCQVPVPCDSGDVNR
jgi:excisionase family DNA binding protein